MGQRGRGRARKQEDEERTETDESALDIPVDEQDEQEEKAAVERAVEQVVSRVEAQAEQGKIIVADEASHHEDDEQDEIVMADEASEPEDEIVMVAEDSESEADEQEDEDVAEYARLAAAGLDLFGTGSKASEPSTASSGARRSAEDIQRSLVPDRLDSGASLHATFLELKGSRRSSGATLRADKRAEAEAQVVSTQQAAVAHSARQREETRRKTAGRKWFDMASEELTPEMRRDFALLRMRNYLDPKKFYKSSDHHKKLPKHFQLGTVIEGAHEFKSARMTKRERQQTFTDEVMADDGIRQYTKRVFHQVQNARMGRGKKKAKTSRRF